MSHNYLLFVSLFSVLTFAFALEDQSLGVNAFTASFTVQAKVNLTFGDNPSTNYYPIPFILSPVFGIFKGKVAFNYPTAEMRIDLSAADTAPFKLKTTTIVSTNSGKNCVYGTSSFNCTMAMYQTQGTAGRCWVYPAYNSGAMPNQMGANMGLVYKGTATVDGYLCLVWESIVNNFIFYVRVTDLATIEIDLPYVFTQIAPIFNFFGGFYGTTYIRFSNIVVGTPSPSNFYPPPYQCNVAPNTVKDDLIAFNDPSKFLDYFLQKALFKAESVIKAMDALRTKSQNNLLKPEKEEKKKRLESQSFPPVLNPTFSANYVFNGSQFYKANGVIITGKVAMDYTQSGFAYSIDSINGSLPFDLQAEFRVSPSRGGFDFIGVNGQSCYDYIFFQWLWSILLPQYQIPPYAVQGPDQKVNGVDCSVWSFSNGGPPTQLFVRKSDNTLIQLTTYFETLSFSTITLYNVVPTVNPAQYSRPSTCIEILGWSHNWASHLPWGWCDPYCWIWW